MTDKLREAAQQALEQVQEFKRRWCLVPAFGNKVNKATREAVTNAHSPIFQMEGTLRAALAEQPAEQDPCPGCKKGGVCRTPKCGRLKLPVDHPFRTTPKPKQEPLTDEQIDGLYRDVWSTVPHSKRLGAFARAIERAHGIRSRDD